MSYASTRFYAACSSHNARAVNGDGVALFFDVDHFIFSAFMGSFFLGPAAVTVQFNVQSR
jgi:hypothetical protein